MTTSLRITNRLLSKLKKVVSYGNYKRTWQEVADILLSYLYNRYIVCANNKYAYSNVYTLFLSLFLQSKHIPWHHYSKLFYYILDLWIYIM